MLYLKTSVKNGIISLYPWNPDEMHYKCEVCGSFYGIDNLSDFLFDDHVFLKDYICSQCEAGYTLKLQNPVTVITLTLGYGNTSVDGSK